MFRLVNILLVPLALWMAVLASSAEGAVRMVSTARVPMPQAAPVSAVERALLADAADDRFDRMSLLEAALVASGTTDQASLARCQRAIAQLASRLAPQIRRLRSTERRAEALLLGLHQHILNGRYIATQSDVRIAVDRGDFNCLSSVILYVALGREFGIEMQPAVLPGHIIAMIPGKNGLKPVETTYAEWFAAVREGRVDTARVPSMENMNPYDRRTATRLADPELIALVYYNQGYEHLTHERFADAWSANQKALKLDPDSHRSRGNFLATVNNWSLALCERGEFVEARQLVAYGLEMAPDYAPLRANNRHVHRLWVEQLAAAGRWQAATDVLEQATRKWPNEPYFAHYLRRVGERS